MVSRSSTEKSIGDHQVIIEKEELKDYDIALHFLKENNVSLDTNTDDVAEFDVNGQKLLSKHILKKLDKYILSFMCAIYFLQFLDKTLLNFSAVMGIKKNLVGNQFGNLGTIFNASYIFGEPIVAYLIQRFPLSKILGTLIILWGIVVASHAACKTYASLMIVRVLLGIFESSSAVGLISISGMYYTKSEQASRIGYWCIQSGTGTIVGGLLSFGFQHVKNKTFESWQILFLVFGIITILFGGFVIAYLPDNVTNAWFLTDHEKALVIEHVRSNQTGTENKKFKKNQFIELLNDKYTWLIFLLTIVSQIVTGAVGTFSVSITATFGFSSYVTALLQLPIGGIIIIVIWTSTQLTSRFGNFTLIHVSLYIPSVIGAIMLLALNKDNNVGNLLGLYLLYSGSTAITFIYTWNSINTAGYTKKIFRNALVLIGFATASIIGPQLFVASSFPRYIPAKITILATQITAIPLTIFIGYLTRYDNIKRDKHGNHKQSQPKNFEFLDLTDIENKNFRYMY